MKQLIIVRHAKSSWDNFELSDHDRPIMKIGIKKTKKIIAFLKEENLIPEMVLSSTATRAKETSMLIAEGIGFEKDKVQLIKSLYDAGSNDIYDELFSIDNNIESVMLVAHNPTLTDFVNDFVSPQIDNLPTTGVVCIEFKTKKWESIVVARFKVKFVVYPRMLP